MPDDPLHQANSWLYHLGDVAVGETDDISRAGYDLIVVEFARYENGETQYTPGEVEEMRGTNDNLVISYLSIGEAESYRYYWDTPEFTNISDRVLEQENPEWEENFKVRYWDPDWQKLIFGYVDKIIDAGFDGIYLDIIDAFYYWEDKDPEGSIDYRQEMADFVAAIRSHISEKFILDLREGPFYIIGQNGEELINYPAYLNAIDGIGREDLQFYYNFTTPDKFIINDALEVVDNLSVLQKAIDAGKKVFAVEYLDQSQQTQNAALLEVLSKILAEKGIPLFIAENRGLDDTFTQPDSVKFSRLTEGTSSDDLMRGGEFGDIISGNQGNDTIWAGKLDEGRDIFIGGEGNDVIGGGPGNDLIIGDNVSEGNTFQNIPLSQDTAVSGSDTLYGSAGNDTLVAGSWKDGAVQDDGRFNHGEAVQTDTANNVMWAGTGNDLVYGAAGDDLIGLRDGSDTVYAGDGNDTIYGAAGNDVIHGEAGNDLIYNGTGDDSVDGGAGDDAIHSTPGTDTLTGGSGRDTFIFTAIDSDDTITDFSLADDTLDLSQIAAFTSLQAVKDATHEFAQNGQTGILISFGDTRIFIAGLEQTDTDMDAISIVFSPVP